MLGEGVTRSTLARVTVDGASGAQDLVRFENGGSMAKIARNILRGTTGTAIVLDGSSTQVEVANNTIVSNGRGLNAINNAPLDLRNSIFAFHSGVALGYNDRLDHRRAAHIAVRPRGRRGGRCPRVRG